MGRALREAGVDNRLALLALFGEWQQCQLVSFGSGSKDCILAKRWVPLPFSAFVVARDMCTGTLVLAESVRCSAVHVLYRADGEVPP